MNDYEEIVTDSCQTLPLNNPVKVCDNFSDLYKGDITKCDANLDDELAPRLCAVHNYANYGLDDQTSVNLDHLSAGGELLGGQHSTISSSTLPLAISRGHTDLAGSSQHTVPDYLANIASLTMETVSVDSPNLSTLTVSEEFPYISSPPTCGDSSTRCTAGQSVISPGDHLSMSSIKFPCGQLERKLGVCSPDEGYSGCVVNTIDNQFSSNSQEKLDIKHRKKAKDAVNGLVHMASIMAATIETAKTSKKSMHSPKNQAKSPHSPKIISKSSHSPKTLSKSFHSQLSTKSSDCPVLATKCSYSTCDAALIDHQEKRAKTDFINDRIDSQNLWETFKFMAEESLRKFSDKKPSRWKTVRHMVQWTPFIQTYKKKKYPWVQLAGHSGNFKAGTSQGTVLKKLCPQEEACYQAIMKDANMKDLVPQYYGSIKMEENEHFIELQDCLSTFTSPCIMDCKVGVRTYLEEELTKARQKPTLRGDMYEKMMSVDPTAPTEEEHRQQGVTKPRYMIWRETISSTATLGFRIEGIKKGGVELPPKDFKTTKSREQLLESFRTFLTGYPEAVAQYIQRLQVIKKSLEKSPFFNSQEVIGSSLLFVHDHTKSHIWLIDFGKTAPVPEDITVDHRSAWQFGNHEDGYLSGLDNIIHIFQQLANDG